MNTDLNFRVSGFQRFSFSPVLLTDCPVVVELKKEFRALDEQEESLKAELRMARPSCGRTIEEELIRVRARKQLIATEIFNRDGLEQKETKPETKPETVLRELR